MAKFSVGQYITFKPEYDYGAGLPIFKITGVSSTNYTILVVKSVPIWEAQGYRVGTTQTVPISNIDPYYMATSYTSITPTTLSDWLPMSPTEGPPLPRLFKIYWPWYKAR